MAKTIENPLKIPSPEALERLKSKLFDDGDFRMPRVKLGTDKKCLFEVPAPTRDDPDNVNYEPVFHAAVVLAKKNHYQSDEDREAGKEAKEKRALYLLLPGKITPYVMFVSPTSVKAWQLAIQQARKTMDKSYREVLFEFSAERIKGKQYTWNKMRMAVSRILTEAEAEHVTELQKLVDDYAARFDDEADLSKLEDEELGVKRVEHEDPRNGYGREKAAEIEEDDDTPSKKKRSAPATKAKRATVDEDDDDDLPKKKKAAAKPVEDDEDEEEAPPKKKAKPVEDDEEDEAPKKKAAKRFDDLDDDEDEAPPKKKAKPVDDDEDEDEAPPKKKKKPVEEEDDED